MRSQALGLLRLYVGFAFLSLCAVSAFAQGPAPESRITQAVDNANLTLLKGNIYPLARPEFDRGIAPPDLPMDRMTLVLRSTPAQQAALATLIDEQQDQSSPNYHKWLTPAQFGQQFGASEQDIQVITSWLQSQGFQVNHVANGRNAIEFSGTAGQVQQAFHTAIHRYSIHVGSGSTTTTEDHWANSSDPQIPAALAPVVVGVATLHNFLKSPQHILSTEKFPFEHTPGRAPQFTTSTGVHAVTPQDLQVIYNATPLYFEPINGAGSTVAVIARSNIEIQDLNEFRGNFANTSPPIQIILNGPNTSDLGGNEEVEAILDASYSTALAPQANEDFVVSATTNTADGVDLSEMYIIDNNLGDVMTESFGGCEEGVTAGEAASISNLAEQAAAQGITYLVSTGDSGSAGCDSPNATSATHGVSVNVLASTPYTVGVGGTMFNEGATPATYWNTTNTAAGASAKSYIPENVWNQSCAAGAAGCTGANLAAGSGGVSVLFPKPSWQAGVTGIPATPNGRNLPDVSLTAAGHDPYLICLRGSCEQGEFEGVAGTSASVQAFGGIMALVRQKIGSRAGQADFVFYKLASTEAFANCNGSRATPVPASTCIFLDTTVGNNAVPGIPNFGTPSADYQTTVGYDRATGLGSVNITNLANQWTSVAFAPSVTTLTINPTTFTHGASATVGITVAPVTGTPSFSNEEASLVSGAGVPIDELALSSTGTASGTTNVIPGGSTMLTAHYPGDGTLGASDSAPVAVTVSPEPSTTTLSILSGASGTAFSGGTFGTPISLNANVTGQSGFGVPTGQVTFNDNGNPITATSGLGPSGPNRASSAITGYFPQTGTHTISANYAGDPSFLASASGPATFTIAVDPTTTTVQANLALIAPGESNILTANIQTTAQGTTAPSGSVAFFSGSTQIGTASPSIVTAGGAVGAVAQLTTTQLPTGTDSITAKYLGDANFAASTSAPTTVEVTTQPDFTLALSPAAVNVANPGLSASTTLTVTAANGFSAATTFSCSGLPSPGAACTFSPTTISGNGTTTITVTTTAATAAVPNVRHIDFRNWDTTGKALRALIFCVGLLALGILARRRRLNLVGGSVVAIMLLIGLAACGGGGGGGSMNPPQTPGTPMVQNQTITVTATSGSLKHTTTFILNVN